MIIIRIIILYFIGLPVHCKRPSASLKAPWYLVRMRDLGFRRKWRMEVILCLVWILFETLSSQTEGKSQIMSLSRISSISSMTQGGKVWRNLAVEFNITAQSATPSTLFVQNQIVVVVSTVGMLTSQLPVQD